MSAVICVRCGRDISAPQEVAEWLRGVFDRAHESATASDLDGMSRAVFVEGFVRGALDCFAQRFEGTCDHCTYRCGDEMTYLDAARAKYYLQEAKR